ncbi:MAG: sigma-70 family RNA polymerase sigma factor [Candidatus Eisenbacteria sp.]|nr:sigma-70 family RNA polymerase sigma factor [Candidatus Eisenbacteria bacterium]
MQASIDTLRNLTRKPTVRRATPREGHTTRGHAPSPGQTEDGRANLNRRIEEAYPALRSYARWLMRGERAGHTLQPTALANEAWLRIANRTTLLASGATRIRRSACFYMKRLLQDHGRRRGRIRHGRDWKRVPLSVAQDKEDGALGTAPLGDDTRAIRQALDKLENTVKSGARERRVLELHFFEGYAFTEIADMLGISDRQVRRDWRHARVWLHRELDQQQD